MLGLSSHDNLGKIASNKRADDSDRSRKVRDYKVEVDHGSALPSTSGIFGTPPRDSFPYLLLSCLLVEPCPGAMPSLGSTKLQPARGLQARPCCEAGLSSVGIAVRCLRPFNSKNISSVRNSRHEGRRLTSSLTRKNERFPAKRHEGKTPSNATRRKTLEHVHTRDSESRGSFYPRRPWAHRSPRHVYRGMGSAERRARH